MGLLCKMVELKYGMCENEMCKNKLYVFNLYNDKLYNDKDDDTIISTLQIVIARGNITGKTRSSFKNNDKDVFQINWVYTNPEYRGQKMATFIIRYSICYMKQFVRPDIKYVILDDDSDNSIYMKKNIYNSIGFIPRDLVSLNMSNDDILNVLGPEKQLVIDDMMRQCVLFNV